MTLKSCRPPISSTFGTRVPAVLVRELAFRSSFLAPGRVSGLCSSSPSGLKRGNGETRLRNRNSNHENDGQGSHSLEGEQPSLVRHLLPFNLFSSFVVIVRLGLLILKFTWAARISFTCPVPWINSECMERSRLDSKQSRVRLFTANW